MSEDVCKAWQGGCKDAYAAGWNDLIKLLADSCCPNVQHCPDDCIKCWTEYIGRLK